tara:strand:+ start:807 stop:908 length:102 start_codon:yes stop_codon:yes gene_type:complete
LKKNILGNKNINMDEIAVKIGPISIGNNLVAAI